MWSVKPTYVLMGGIAMLVMLLNERARFVAALVVFVIVVISAAQVMGVDLRIWK